MSVLEAECLANLVEDLPLAEPFVTAEKVAEHLGISVSLVRKATVQGPLPIPHHRIPGGRSVRYLLSEVDSWIIGGSSSVASN